MWRMFSGSVGQAPVDPVALLLYFCQDPDWQLGVKKAFAVLMRSTLPHAKVQTPCSTPVISPRHPLNRLSLRNCS